MESEQVNPDGDEHASVKGDPEPERRSHDRRAHEKIALKNDPKPDTRRHAGQGFMRKAVRQSQIARRADKTYTSQGRICPHKWMLN